MSASIPTCLKNFIKEQIGINNIITADKEDLIIRHKIHYFDNPIVDYIDKIKSDINNGKKVLICVNTVKLSQ